MRAAWIFAYNLINRVIPNGLSLYLLGAGLLAAGLAQFVASTDAYYGYRIEIGLALLALMFANCALAAVAIANMLRRSSSLASLLRRAARRTWRFDSSTSPPPLTPRSF